MKTWVVVVGVLFFMVLLITVSLFNLRCENSTHKYLQYSVSFLNAVYRIPTLRKTMAIGVETLLMAQKE